MKTIIDWAQECCDQRAQYLAYSRGCRVLRWQMFTPEGNDVWSFEPNALIARWTGSAWVVEASTEGGAVVVKSLDVGACLSAARSALYAARKEARQRIPIEKTFARILQEKPKVEPTPKPPAKAKEADPHAERRRQEAIHNQMQAWRLKQERAGALDELGDNVLTAGIW